MTTFLNQTLENVQRVSNEVVKEKYEEIADKENSKAKTWQTFSSTFRDFAAFKLVGANGNKSKLGSNNVFWAKEIQGNQLIAKNVIAFFYCY